MPPIQQNKSLKQFNTFGIDVSARYFIQISGIADMLYIIHNARLKPLPWLILGGGSNILFTQNFDGLVVKNNIRGIEIHNVTKESVSVKCFSGQVWHDLVLFAINQNLGGIENLSLIPGTVGAAPVQNIGAYGVELKDTFESLEAIDLQTGELVVFSYDACKFGYRDSIFKNGAKGKYFILSVTLKLSKDPKINASYGLISRKLENAGITNPTIRDISHAVCEIRQSRLPDPAVIGNAGSFFKNPEIETSRYEKIKIEHQEMPGYVVNETTTKIPAGWLIEQCGWKGKPVGNTGTHQEHALVLVNYGNATGDEIKSLALEIQKSVKDKFGIEIAAEVNVV